MKKRAIPALLFVLLVLLSPLVAAGAPSARPGGIQTLWYGKGKMEQAARNHLNPRFRKTGDYVPTLRLTSAELDGCLVAVNWNSRHWVAQNRRLTIDFYDPRQGRWERHVCRAVDWQQRKHSTGSRQRFELDYDTGVQVNAVPNNTVARIVKISHPSR